jgi:hypothetical protein
MLVVGDPRPNVGEITVVVLVVSATVGMTGFWRHGPERRR